MRGGLSFIAVRSCAAIKSAIGFSERLRTRVSDISLAMMQMIVPESASLIENMALSLPHSLSNVSCSHAFNDLSLCSILLSRSRAFLLYTL